MKNNNGVLLRRPSEKASINKSSPTFLIGLLTIILIVSYVFTIKIYEPVRNIMITGGILVYPFTFLIIAYISKYYGFKESRKSIFISALLFTIFIALMMICIMPKSNNATSGYSAVIQYLYANDYFMLGETRIYYPPLGQFFGVLISFIASHLVYATIYNAIHKLTVDYLAMGLSIFIGFIIDKIIFMPLLFLKNLLDEVNTFDFFMKCITSEFIGAILSSLVIIIIYVILTSIKDKKKKLV